MVCVENRKMFFKKMKIGKDRVYVSKINKKCAKKLVKKMKQYNEKSVVCCKEIMKNDIFINYLYSKGIKIYDGRKLYKEVIYNIFEYLKDVGINLNKKSIAIMLNDYSEENLKLIYLASNIFKNITLVTNHAEYFRKIENELEKYGIIINISNNKRKSVNKVDIILNIDFPGELINKYYINKRAIIINIEESVTIDKKSFQGININYYEIDFDDEFDKYSSFDNNIVYEGMFYEGENVAPVVNLKVKNLIGNRGKISVKEFENVNKS